MYVRIWNKDKFCIQICMNFKSQFPKDTAFYARRNLQTAVSPLIMFIASIRFLILVSMFSVKQVSFQKYDPL